MSRNWTPQEQSLADKYIMETQGRSMSDQQFYMVKTIEGVRFSMHTNEYDTDHGVLLAFVNSYKKKNDKLYV